MSQQQEKSVPNVVTPPAGTDDPAYMQRLEALEADIAKTAEARTQRRAARQQEEQREGVSRAALNMRERRKRADIQEQERKALQARDKARRILAARHPEEYMTHVQECRKALGLPPLRPRGHSGRSSDLVEVTPQHPAHQQEQQKCLHGNYPMKKLPYGKFCGNCGTKL